MPLIDRLLPGGATPGEARCPPSSKGDSRETAPDPAPRRLAALAWPWRPHALAFCGFYVAKADTKLFNQASQVVLVRDGDRTVLTMANDFQGDLKEFAVVIPVPTVLKREQIHVAEPALLDHLDAYSAPRLVEYFDENPCQPRLCEMAAPAAAPRRGRAPARPRPATAAWG